MKGTGTGAMKPADRGLRAGRHFVGQVPPSCRGLQAHLHHMAQAHPELCEIEQIGRSRSGEVLKLLRVNGGDNNALVVGCPPIGLASLLALAQYVLTHAEARAASTWYFLACSDPDGARLNEEWIADWPPTLESYYRCFYRPARWNQPEWTFPTPGFTGQLPETTALMAAIDEIRPELYISLDTVDAGGAHLVSFPVDAHLPSTLESAAARHRIPIEEAPWDCLGWKSRGPGVYVLPASSQQTVDTAAGRGAPVHGASSVHYAGQYGLALFSKVPLWHTHVTAVPAAAGAGLHEAATATLEGVLQRIRPHAQETVFLPAVEDSLTNLKLLADLTQDQSATDTDQHLALLFPLRAAGMLLRHLDAQPVSHPALATERALLNLEFASWCQRAEAALQPAAIPLADTAGFHVDVALKTAAALATPPFTEVR